VNEPSWPRLTKLDAREAERITALAQAASRLGLDGARGRLDALIEGTLDWTLASVDRAPASEHAFGAQALAAVALSLPEGPALVLADLWLVHIAVDRVLGGEGTRALEVSPLTETEEGVLAFLVANMIVGSGAQVVSALRDARACAAWLNESPCDRWHWRVRAGEHSAFVTLWVASQITAASLAPGTVQHARELPSTLQLRIGLATLTHAEIASLAVGDVVLPDTLSISATREGALVGAVDWCALAGTPMLRTTRAHADEPWCVAPSQAVSQAHHATVENSMSDSKREADLPVELAVTLGQITLTHAEALAMVPGSILKTGIPAGARVQLVAGGTLIARGELVEVAGELGVRILSLHT
jgi:type III secretion system YscQ/HrcQ family protein